MFVNIFFTRKAAKTLIHPQELDPSDQPKLKIMLVFSSLNLGMDILNVTCFARAKKLFGFDVPEIDTSMDHHVVQRQIGHSNDCYVDAEHFMDESGVGTATSNDELSKEPMDNSSCHPRDDTVASISRDSSTDSAEHETNYEQALISKTDTADYARRDASGIGVDEAARNPDPDDSANLNMCSAYTVSTSPLL